MSVLGKCCYLTNDRSCLCSFELNFAQKCKIHELEAAEEQLKLVLVLWLREETQVQEVMGRITGRAFSAFVVKNYFKRPKINDKKWQKMHQNENEYFKGSFYMKTFKVSPHF